MGSKEEGDMGRVSLSGFTGSSRLLWAFVRMVDIRQLLV